MVKKIRHLSILVGYLIVICQSAQAQYENIWAFGYHAGLDFNTNPPTPTQTRITTLESSAAICNDDGQLLFYTDGSNVFDRNHSLMPNGINLTGLPIYNFPGWGDIFSTWHAFEAALIVPWPGTQDKYFIFSNTSTAPGGLYEDGRLYYSVIDMSLNNGLGDVVAGSKGVLIDTMLSQGMVTVPGNSCDVWLLTVSPEERVLKGYNVGVMGLNMNPRISSIQESLSPNKIWASDDRGKVIVANTGGFLVLYDFDPWLGMVSNPRIFDTVGTQVGAFSADGSKFYNVHPWGWKDLYQFDLSQGSAADIAASKTLVFSDSVNEDRMAISAMQRGPDGKIYVANNYDFPFPRSVLHVINNPNLLGQLCNFLPNSLPLINGTHFAMGMPTQVRRAFPDTAYVNHYIDGSCFAVGVQLIPSDTTGWGYSWYNGGGGSSRMVNRHGAYWVGYFTDVCTYNVDSFFVPGDVPSIQVLSECKDDGNGRAYATTYAADPVHYTYTWLRGSDTLSISDTLSDVPAGSYSLHVQTDTGCDTLLYFDIPEVDFRVSFAVSDTISCLGDALQFQNTSDTHFTAFFWALGNGESYSLPELQDYRYPEPGAYRVMLTGAGEICKDTAYQTILVDQQLVPHFDVVPKAVCAGQPVSFSPHTDSTTTQIQWDLAGQARVEASIENQYQHAFDRSGVFPVTVGVQSRACPDTSYTDSIRVYPLPEVDLGGDTSICLHGSPVYLKNLHDAPLSPYHQMWSTGDTTEVLKVVHPGIYTLSVTDERIGCTTTESIAIRKDCYIDVPNAFTPNGDGNNDYFFPRQLLSESVNRFHMQVFNRWGQIVFETNRLDGRGWDGSFNDKFQPTGVYLYRISVDFANGRQEQYDGNVTLVR